MFNNKKKIKLVSVEDSSFKKISYKLNKELEIYKLQSYFPILSNYFDFYNNSTKQFTLKTRYRIKDILHKYDNKIDDAYIKHFLECKIYDIYRKKHFDSTLFIKILPLLNVTHYLTDNYKTSNSILPDLYSYNTLKKINNFNNTAYIDVFFSYLGSMLTETGKCPSFPLFYGTFTGVKSNFKCDISDDYDDLCEIEEFKRGYGLNYHFEEMRIDKDNTVNIELLNSECVVELSDIENPKDTVESNLIVEEYGEDIDVLEEEEEEVENSNDNKDTISFNRRILNNDNDSDNNNYDNNDSNNNNNSDNEVSVNDNDDSDNEVSDNNYSVITKLNKCDDNKILETETNVKLQSNNDNETDYSDLYSTTDISSENEGEDEYYVDSMRKMITEADLSDIRRLDKTDTLSDISASTNKSGKLKYVVIPEFPVQLNCIEKLTMTLDNYLDNSMGRKISPIEWKSILFQVCFGLAVAQKEYNFVHNDLHSSNIMFKNTEINYLFFSFRNKYFKIPTFKKISKIIDFGRATFSVGNKIYFSDVFKKNEDAGGQYTYPFQNSLKNCKIKPNKSFDLSRLATTLIDRFENLDSSYNEIVKLLEKWVTDKYGNNIMYMDDSFDLYKIIAKNVKSAVPYNQLYNSIWNDFIIDKQEIPDHEYIYRL